MTGNKNNKNNTRLKRLSKSQREWVGVFIAAKSNVAVQRFMTAGAEVLQSEFGFTDEQLEKWAEATVVLGQKYLKIKDIDDD